MIENGIWEKYEKKEFIGSASYGNIYKVLNKYTRNYVAIKEIDKNKYNSSINLFNESKIMKKINYDNSINLKETIKIIFLYNNGFMYYKFRRIFKNERKKIIN